MPTIEIVSLHCEIIPNLPRFSTFAYIPETELRSHRALFQPVFGQTSGVIVHLGNKGFQKDIDENDVGWWFAGGLIDWPKGKKIILPAIDFKSDEEQWWGEDQDDLYRFRADVVPELRELLNLMIGASPVRKAYFSTDYQFGPSKPMQRENYTIGTLFDEHDRYGLRWNCLYEIVETTDHHEHRPIE